MIAESVHFIRTDSLVDVAVNICNAKTMATQQLVETLLALPDDDESYEPGGLSGLNSDGTPLQFCISSREEGWAGRFISDPASSFKNPGERYRKSYAALKQLYWQTETEVLEPFCEAMFDFLLPEDRTELPEYPDGVLWLGAAVQGPGLAVYMDGRCGGNTVAWSNFGRWLKNIMPQNQQIDPLIAALTPNAEIMSIGFEGSSLKNLRAKVYWRLTKPVLLDDLGSELLANDEYKEFLNELVSERTIKITGLVFSMGFHVASQQIFDAKIDVCGCPDCVHNDAQTWTDTLTYFTNKYSLPAFPITDELHTKKCAVSYFGFGLDILGNKRLNLYLKAYAN